MNAAQKPCADQNSFPPGPPPLPPLPPSFSARVVKSLEAYDLLNDVGGLPLVQLDVEDVFWAVLEDLDVEAPGRKGGREGVDWEGGKKGEKQ